VNKKEVPKVRMDVSQYFATQGCRMIERLPKSRIRYVAQCGHEHITNLSTFKNGSSRKCKQCTIQNLKNGDWDYHKQEGESLLYISKLLEPHIEVKRTNEGCLADFLIRPLGTSVDEWAQVQLKTTGKMINAQYLFHLKRRYPNCIILCHCMSENRFWIFRDYEVPEKGLGITNSGKYSQNEVVLSHLVDKMKTMYETTQHISAEIALTPSSPYQLIEHQYRLKREKFFAHIHFEYPLYQHRRYDFIVNGEKYQEKVASRNTSENSYHFHSEYVMGENDYYFIHIADSDYFYCIPELELISRQKPSGRVTLNTSKHKEWYAPYRHQYTRVSFSF
jgi:hypothetical protein